MSPICEDLKKTIMETKFNLEETVYVIYTMQSDYSINTITTLSKLNELHCIVCALNLVLLWFGQNTSIQSCKKNVYCFWLLGYTYNSTGRRAT